MKGQTFVLTVVFSLLLAGMAFSQTAEAYQTDDSTSTTGGLFNPSRFKIHHNLSFGMGASQGSSVKSQSLYTTMLEYKFRTPVTLNLNFGFPLHSTVNEHMNLSQENVTSAEYFRNMPLDFSLTWRPRQNMMMRLSVERYQSSSFLTRPMVPFQDDRVFNSW